MPHFCSVHGCTNRSNRERDKSFFRVPKVMKRRGEQVQKLLQKRRQAWITNINTEGAESGNARVCSDHFVTGRPSDLVDENSQDWAPTVKMGCQCRKAQLKKVKKSLDSETTFYQDAVCQTDLTMEDLRKLEEAVSGYKSEICRLRKNFVETEYKQEAFQNDDKTKFYTGLPNFLVLNQIFRHCEPCITDPALLPLSKFEQFVMVLMRLRLNLQLQDLAYRFNVSTATVSQIWVKVINILYERLEFLIDWPERDAMQSTMPMSFRDAFGSKVAVILDCFEVVIENPSNLLARAQSRSNDQHRNAVKFLIGIAPHGYVTYISRAWGGRASDKQVTEECGILKKLLPGDVVLADCGFNDEEGFYCASLKTFAKGKKLLSAYEVEQTRKLESVRLHVQSVSGLVWRKYQILQSRAMTIEHVAVKSNGSLALIEKIAVICCALSNFSEPVVPLE